MILEEVSTLHDFLHGNTMCSLRGDKSGIASFSCNLYKCMCSMTNSVLEMDTELSVTLSALLQIYYILPPNHYFPSQGSFFLAGVWSDNHIALCDGGWVDRLGTPQLPIERGLFVVLNAFVELSYVPEIPRLNWIVRFQKNAS